MTTPPRPTLAELLDTWQSWSERDMLLRALAMVEDDSKRADILRNAVDRRPVVNALDALAANHELVSLLSGWQWHAIYAARKAGSSWAEIGTAIGQAAAQVRASFQEAVDRAERHAPEYTDVAAYRAVLDDPPCPSDLGARPVQHRPASGPSLSRTRRGVA